MNGTTAGSCRRSCLFGDSASGQFAFRIRSYARWQIPLLRC